MQHNGIALEPKISSSFFLFLEHHPFIILSIILLLGSHSNCSIAKELFISLA
jgi:hypothetical protein